jgi:hypothetical protein
MQPSLYNAFFFVRTRIERSHVPSYLIDGTSIASPLLHKNEPGASLATLAFLLLPLRRHSSLSLIVRSLFLHPERK